MFPCETVFGEACALGFSTDGPPGAMVPDDSPTQSARPSPSPGGFFRLIDQDGRPWTIFS
jgi:hypothetical protein